MGSTALSVPIPPVSPNWPQYPVNFSDLTVGLIYHVLHLCLYLVDYVSDSDRVVTSTAPIIIYYDCIDPTDLASCMFNLTSSDDQECVHGNDIDVRIQCDSELCHHMLHLTTHHYSI